MASLRAFALDPKLFNPRLYASVIKFWFGDLPPAATTPQPEQNGRWFGVGADAAAKAQMDGECRSAYGAALASIAPDKFRLPAFANVDADRTHYADIAHPFVEQFDLRQDDAQAGDPAENALGLTILLDQFPRNIFRDKQALIYDHYDRISRAVLSEIRQRKLDQQARFLNHPPWGMWFYLPLMHSESLADHEAMQKTVTAMKDCAEGRQDSACLEYLKVNEGFGERHTGILRRFGRYPHRNKASGREPTLEEKEWLENGGDTFGA